MPEAEAVAVLDHGAVRLVQSYGSDEMVCRAARVSVAGGVREGEASPARDRVLIEYLAKHLHTSPFEHCGATLYVKAPIFVLRQWHRHRTHSYNELSGRYSTIYEHFYVPTADRLLTEQSQDSRQGAGRVEGPEAAEAARTLIREHGEAALAAYRRLLGLNVSREVSRAVLPVNVYSEMFDTCNLWNWTRFLKLRLARDAQYEIRMYARAIHRILRGLFPVSMGAFAALEGWEGGA